MTEDSGVDYTLPEGAFADSSPTIDPQPTTSPSPEGAPPPESQPAEEHRIPYARFQAVVAARQKIEQEAAQARAESALLRQQIQALTGVKSDTLEDPQEAAIRAALFKVMPQLKHLEHLPFDKITEMLNAVPQLQQASQARYDDQADQTLTALFESAKDLYGKTDLDAQQKDMLHASFVRWLETDAQARSRYVRQGASVVPEFLKQFTAKMLDPIRRQAAVSMDTRVMRASKTPTGGSVGGPVGTAPPKIPEGNEDALHEAAYAAFVNRRGA